MLKLSHEQVASQKAQIAELQSEFDKKSDRIKELEEKSIEVESLFAELVNVLKVSGVVSSDFQPPRTIVELDLLEKGFDVTPLNTRIPEFRKDKS
jgi:predicted transcriptional regulator